MRHAVIPALVAGVLAGVLVGLPAVSAQAQSATDGCGQGSWTAGAIDLCDGVLVYRDYVYDDHGASLAGLPDDRAEGLYAALRAPSDAYGDLATAGVVALAGVTGDRDNTADLVALRVRLVGDELEVTAELNTMFEPDKAIVVVGIDTDNDPATSAGPSWPHGLIANPFRLLPADQALVNHGLDEFVVMTQGNPDTNMLATRAPRPPGAAWRIQAVVAREIPAFPAGPIVMNVAFRGLDERGHWWENAQAKALANNDISAMGTTVAVSDLVARVSREQVVPNGLVRQRVYTSEYPVGEGLRPPDRALAKLSQARGTIDFLGKYQPYGLVVPDLPGPHGIQFVLHGLGENHSALLADPAGMQNPPPIALQLGIPFNRIIVVALGRGPGGFYVGAAERDFHDVLADIEATTSIDRDRVFSGGMSMGGYGGLRMLALHPDLFAAAITWVAFTGDLLNGTPAANNGLSGAGGLGNIVDLLGNSRHVPIGALYSAQDELVHVNQAIAIRNRLAELGLPSAHWLHHGATHSTHASIQDYAKEAAWIEGHTRAQDPPRVTFRTDQRFFDAAFDLAPDGAWWVDDIVPAGPGYADVDAISHGCGAGDPITELTTGVGTGPAIIPWDGQFIDIVGKSERTATNHVEITLTNVASVSIDVGDPAAPTGERQACLSAEELTCGVVTDVPTRISFSDGRQVELPAGDHECQLAAADQGGRVVKPVTSPSTLPATGGGKGVAGLVALAVLAVVGVRRPAAGSRP